MEASVGLFKSVSLSFRDLNPALAHTPSPGLWLWGGQPVGRFVIAVMPLLHHSFGRVRKDSFVLGGP
jgi:hypothetical protein